MVKKISPALIAAVLHLACSPAQDVDTLITEGYDRQEMDEAIERARSEIEVFISALEQGDGEEFAVKAPVSDQDDVEHFWLVDVSFENGAFTGIVNNEPGIVGNVELGQQLTVGKAEISDWSVMRDGKLHGNYTMRPLLKTLLPEQAERFRSMLAEP